jgi:hypothetical protein
MKRLAPAASAGRSPATDHYSTFVWGLLVHRTSPFGNALYTTCQIREGLKKPAQIRTRFRDMKAFVMCIAANWPFTMTRGLGPRDSASVAFHNCSD